MEIAAEVKDLILNMIKDLNEVQLQQVADSLNLTVKEGKNPRRKQSGM